ncbi:hypothetical protein ACFLWC_04820 [Chloroflexota bacterium]
MSNFKIIDAHTHLARTAEEEENWWIIPGRRACDRWSCPEGIGPYMDRIGISKIVVLTLIPRQERKPLYVKAKLLELSGFKQPEKEKQIRQQITRRQ